MEINDTRVIMLVGVSFVAVMCVCVGQQAQTGWRCVAAVAGSTAHAPMTCRRYSITHSHCGCGHCLTGRCVVCSQGNHWEQTPEKSWMCYLGCKIWLCNTSITCLLLLNFFLITGVYFHNSSSNNDDALQTISKFWRGNNISCYLVSKADYL